MAAITHRYLLTIVIVVTQDIQGEKVLLQHAMCILTINLHFISPTMFQQVLLHCDGGDCMVRSVLDHA